MPHDKGGMCIFVIGISTLIIIKKERIINTFWQINIMNVPLSYDKFIFIQFTLYGGVFNNMYKKKIFKFLN